MKSFAIVLTVLVSLTSHAETGRKPNEWTKTPNGKLSTSYKQKIETEFLRLANSKDSLVQKDVQAVIKAHDESFSGCGGVEIPSKFKATDLMITPFEYNGFFGRHCVPKIEDCDTEDNESFLILVPYVSTCTRTTEGSSLAYKMSFVPSFNGGKDRFEGPTKVKISE